MGTSSSGSEVSDEGCESQEVSGSKISQIGLCTPCDCQVLRSFSYWFGGTSQTEDNLYKAYCSLIKKAEKFIYIENQFSFQASQKRASYKVGYWKLYTNVYFVHIKKKNALELSV